MARQMKDSGIEWIGEIPAEWAVSRVKYVSDFEPGCNGDGLTDKSVITYTPMDCIKNGWFINNTATRGSVSSSLTAYQNGDIVMAKVTPCFENGNIAIMENLASGYGLGSSELFVFRPVDIDTRYFFYWLRNPMFVQLACSTMTGTGGLKRVSPYFAKNCYIHQPPLAEQHRIAAFLDRKCAEIDAVIERTKATIEEYKQLKQAVITEAVTKGVRGARKMKNSGIEWIGEIPEEWNISSIKYGVTKVGSGKTPLGGAESYADEGILFLRSQNVYDTGLVLDSPTYITDEVDAEMSNTRVQPGDVLLNITGASIGRCCVFPAECQRANVNQHVCIIRVIRDTFMPEFMHYYWVSALGHTVIDLYQTGGNREGMSADAIKNAPIIYMSLEEQAEISMYLDEKCAALDTLIAKKTALLTELETYKKSLIYEYVTGKKEVL